MRLENLDNIRITDHAMTRFGQWVGMKMSPSGRMPEHILERVDGNEALLVEEISISLENPSWDRIVEYRQHNMETGEYEKTLYVVDLKHLFYDEECEDHWAFIVAVVIRRTDEWVVETFMPEGFVATSVATEKFRRAS